MIGARYLNYQYEEASEKIYSYILKDIDHCYFNITHAFKIREIVLFGVEKDTTLSLYDETNKNNIISIFENMPGVHFDYLERNKFLRKSDYQSWLTSRCISFKTLNKDSVIKFNISGKASNLVVLGIELK